MAEILLFHHALGLTDAVRGLADALRSAGHVVHTPDLYDGLVFDDLEAGVANAEQIGFETIAERGSGAAEALPGDLIVIGISLGVLPAQKLAQTRPGVAGAVLIEACVPPDVFGRPWSDGLPVDVHGVEGDEFFAGDGDLEVARELVAGHDDRTLFLYPGDGHLLIEPERPGHDPAAAELLTERVLAFVAARA